MKTYATKDITCENILEELPKLLSKLPYWRKEKALGYHFDTDKYRCAITYLLLEEMLKDIFNVSYVPPFSYQKQGKPYLKDYPNIHFSMSHTTTGVACAVGDEPIGIDIETLRYNNKVAKLVLSNSEFEHVVSAKSPEKQFITYWTQKESYLKLTGQKLTRKQMRTVLSNNNNVLFETHINTRSKYLVSIASWKILPYK